MGFQKIQLSIESSVWQKDVIEDEEYIISNEYKLYLCRF